MVNCKLIDPVEQILLVSCIVVFKHKKVIHQRVLGLQFPIVKVAQSFQKASAVEGPSHDSDREPASDVPLELLVETTEIRNVRLACNGISATYAMYLSEHGGLLVNCFLKMHGLPDEEWLNEMSLVLGLELFLFSQFRLFYEFSINVLVEL